MQVHQVPMVSVDELGSKLGRSDLARILAAASVPVVQVNGTALVAEASWYDFVARLLSGEQPEHDDSNIIASSKAQLPQQAEWFRQHPLIANLRDEFVRYVQLNAPDIGMQRHGWTTTFVLPQSGRAGLSCQARCLALYANRQGKTTRERVASQEDFARCLDWLRNLPPR